jgi:hypothetical protein
MKEATVGRGNAHPCMIFMKVECLLSFYIKTFSRDFDLPLKNTITNLSLLQSSFVTCKYFLALAH